MPKYKTHLVGGFATFIVLTQVLSRTENMGSSLQQSFWNLSFCLIGSLFPDIDTKSKIQKLMYYFMLAIILLAISTQQWKILSIASLLALVPLLVNHRNLTHKLWFVILAPLSIPILFFYYYDFFTTFNIHKLSLFFIRSPFTSTARLWP